jgi:hypothetical protein
MRPHGCVGSAGMRGRHHPEDVIGLCQRAGEVLSNFDFGSQFKSGKIDFIYTPFAQHVSYVIVVNPQADTVGAVALAKRNCQSGAPASPSDNGDFLHSVRRRTLR